VTSPQDLRICIIGAGPSGLATAKNLLQAGFRNFTVFEKNDRVGGNWIYSTRSGHSSVYESVRSISSKTLSQLEDFPFPAYYPSYPSQSLLLKYFESYAARFGLFDHIQFGAEVQRAEKAGGQRWIVTLHDGSTQEFHALFVCNGHHWSPRMPVIPGAFTGRFLHSHDFKSPHIFGKDRVLVVGGGNSAADIAVQVVRATGSCSMSLRRGYHVLPRFIFGIPSDVWYARLAWLPGPVLKLAGGRLTRLAVAAYTRQGLPKPDHPLLACHPLINSELLYYIRKRRIQTLPGVVRFDGNRVWFNNGSSGEFDTVIACTGYAVRFPFFNRNFINYEDGVPMLYLRMFHPEHRDLFFIGLVQPNGSIWPLADLQAKLAANYLLGNYQLPDDLEQRCSAEADSIRRSFVRTPRHNLEVHYHEFRRLLLNQIPASAPAWKGDRGRNVSA
jgi:hypothetical protein